jgi:hypothetical protein
MRCRGVHHVFQMRGMHAPYGVRNAPPPPHTHTHTRARARLRPQALERAQLGTLQVSRRPQQPVNPSAHLPGDGGWH